LGNSINKEFGQGNFIPFIRFRVEVRVIRV
jgi:hypothetical protein